MSILPNIFSTGGNDRGQGVYTITEFGKTALDNGDLNPKEIAIMQALDCIPSGTANLISKNSNVDKQTVQALIGSLINRKFVRKIN